MIILIAGGTHTGKTLFAQKLLEKYFYPYLSIDHLKMGLIRSGHCALSPESSCDDLTKYLWPVVCEMMKTSIENRQNLIIEGSYIPFDYKKYFLPEYLQEIRYICLIFTEKYIKSNFDEIKAHSEAIECRNAGCCLSKEMILLENAENLKRCKEYGLDYLLIDDKYKVDWNLQF